VESGALLEETTEVLAFHSKLQQGGREGGREGGKENWRGRSSYTLFNFYSPILIHTHRIPSSSAGISTSGTPNRYVLPSLPPSLPASLPLFQSLPPSLPPSLPGRPRRLQVAMTLPGAARNKPQKSHTLQPSLPPSLPPSLLRDRSALVAPSGNGVTWCCKERICESTAARKQQRPSRQSHCRDV